MGAKDVLGREGEQAAVSYLEGCGFRILDRNWRCADGEIDIVAADRRTFVVCEVKTRSGTRFGTPLDAVGQAKRRRLRRLGCRCLHLCGRWRLGLSVCGKRHDRTQSNPTYLSLKSFHANCRGPHTGQSLTLSPLVAVLRTEGHVGRSTSSLEATASCQFTSPNTLRQGIPSFASFAAKQSAASASAP